MDQEREIQVKKGEGKKMNRNGWPFFYSSCLMEGEEEEEEGAEKNE